MIVIRDDKNTSHQVFDLPFIDYPSINKIDRFENKVRTIQKHLHVSPLQPIKITLSDNTKVHYSGLVRNQNNTLFFLKIRLFDDAYVNNHFYKNKILGEILNKFPDISLNSFTPALIEGTDDYLLYQYTPGKHIGERDGYNQTKYRKSHTKTLIDILQSILDFPIELLPDNFERHGWSYIKFNIVVGGNFENSLHEFERYFNTHELESIQLLLTNKKYQDLVDEKSVYLSHCDFQPTNVLKYQNRFHLVDWDASGIDHKFYDLIKFYLVHYRKPRLQDYFFHEALKQIGIKDNEMIVLLLALISRSIFECKILINILSNKQSTDYLLLKHIMDMRVKHVKIWIQQLNSFS